MKYRAVRGMEDILPGGVGIWQALERTARAELESYGYREIRTPILEHTAVFSKSIGEGTDIVTKEMFTFKDRKGRSLTLRPEGTAPIARAYVEHSLDKVSPEQKFYYIGPMFRSERPQKGRARQFHQIGVEVFGTYSPYADAEVIAQMEHMLGAFGLKDFTVKINSLGCRGDRERFVASLRESLSGREKRLCKDCRERLGKNALRILDCKNESCAQVVREISRLPDSLCVSCDTRYKKLKYILRNLNVRFREERGLVRGLDYYTGTVFEVTHPALGAQDALAAGGRYDDLVRDFGGPAIGAVGYALGMERAILALGKSGPPQPRPVSVYIATLGEEAKIKGVRIAGDIRKRLPGICVFTDIKETSLKSQMRNADKNNARFVIILGEDELKQGKAVFRDMACKRQEAVGFDDIVPELKKRI